MKICLICKKVKPLDDFYNRGGKRKNEKQTCCIDCSKNQSNNHKRFISNLVKRWKLFKGCNKCHFKASHSCQLDIDHIIPKHKTGNDRQAINTSWTKKRLKQELSKCQVLCANCHRLKSFEDGLMFGGRNRK